MFNEAFLLGRVGKKDCKATKLGGAMTSLALATSRKHIDENGERKEFTTWHNVYFFSKLAEVVQQYAHVGDVVFVRGEISNRKIESGDRAGQWVYSVIGNEIKFIPSSKKRENVGETTAENYAKFKGVSVSEFNDEDVPF